MGGGGGGGGRGGDRGGRRNQAGSNLRKPRWDISRLEPFKKDFYVPQPSVANRLVNYTALVQNHFLFSTQLILFSSYCRPRPFHKCCHSLQCS